MCVGFLGDDLRFYVLPQHELVNSNIEIKIYRDNQLGKYNGNYKFRLKYEVAPCDLELAVLLAAEGSADYDGYYGKGGKEPCAASVEARKRADDERDLQQALTIKRSAA